MLVPILYHYREIVTLNEHIICVEVMVLPVHRSISLKSWRFSRICMCCLGDLVESSGN